jgi:hypothetical protein
MLLPSVYNCLEELVVLIDQLSYDEYTQQCLQLSNATIGEHARHIIEMFQCLEQFYDAGIVNYDLRQRNNDIQTDTAFAIKCIQTIQNNLDKPNKEIELRQVIEREQISITSNYYRELLYNLEHCIHHQALLKVALFPLKNISIATDFGVASSTTAYRKTCVQ